jgi:chromosome segregation ATPase
LQEDIARLKRDLSLYRSRAEEAHHTNETLKEQILNIGERLRNSEQSNETNLASIARKDRKIEELRLEVQNEKARRVRAEAETSKVNQLMSEEQDEFHRKAAELQESTNHYSTQYEALSKASLRERSDMQRKLKGVRDEISALREQAEKKEKEQERLDALVDHQNQEVEAETKRIKGIFDAYESYKTARDNEFQVLLEKARHNQATVDAAVASMKEAEDKMKWTMSVKKNIEWSE